MSLRDDLGKRFMDIFYSPIEMDWEAHDATRRHCLAAADECIRQMEWARRECSLISKVDEGCGWFKMDTLPNLTLSPPDWKPDA